MQGDYQKRTVVSISKGFTAGPTKTGKVTWWNIPARDKYYFVTYNDNAGPPVYVNGYGTITNP